MLIVTLDECIKISNIPEVSHSLVLAGNMREDGTKNTNNHCMTVYYL